MESHFILILLCGYLGVSSAQVSRAVNMHIFDGVQLAQGVTLAQCLELCVQTPGCLAIDYNFPGSSCWFHDADTVCNRKASKSSCVHYSFTQCPLQGTPQGVNALQGQHLFNGVLQNGISTLESCLQQCAARRSCTGLDFDTNGDTCWLHDTTSECTVPGNKATCTHYRFITCEDPGPVVTERPDIAPPLNTFESFSGRHIKRGRLRRGVVDVLSCLQLCWTESGCQGFDFNANNFQCWTHTEDTECDSMTDKAGCTHYRVLANCIYNTFVNCANIGYTTPIDNSHSVDGELVGQGTTQETCQAMCTALVKCVAVDFEKNTGNCFVLYYTGLPEMDTCCTHSIKFCADATTPVTTGQPITIPSTLPTRPTPMPTTTAVAVAQPTPIPDDGKCPSPFARYDNAKMTGGTLNDTVNTAEGCKELCISMSTNCVAIDFNNDAEACFTRATLDLNAFEENEACCTHWRKLPCEQRQCFVHGPVDVTELFFDAIRGPNPTITIDEALARIDIRTADFNPPKEDCNGACYTSTTFLPESPGSTLPNVLNDEFHLLIERGCNSSPRRAGKVCDVNVLDPSTDYTQMTCNCYGDSCNAFGILLNECVGYYPMDCSGNDLSFALRHGIDINVKYDAFNMQKNYSAIFEGDARIKIPSFANFLWGRVDETSGERSPAFTITMWAKRIGTNNIQYLFSNGDSFNIYSEPVDASNHIIKCQVTIDGVSHTAAASPVPFGEWNWIACVVNDATIDYMLDLYVDDTDMAADSVNTGIPSSMQGINIDTQFKPVCFGDRSVIFNQLDADGATVNPFVGNIDEVWMFRRSVSAELPIVKETSTRNSVFLP